MGRKSNAEERRSQIIRALYDCLVEKGHEKVTIKEIARKAGLPPGVIHYYFKSKDEIVSTLAVSIIEKYTMEIQSLIKGAKSPAGQIESAIEFIVDRLIFNLPLNRVFYNLIQMGFEREDLGRSVKGMLENYRQKMARVFQDAGAGNDSVILGASLVAVAEGFSLQYMVDPSSLNRDEVKIVISKILKNPLESKP